jgi:hypothetical protein
MYFDFRTWFFILRQMAFEPFRPRRALFLGGVFTGLTLFGAASFVALALDYVFFPGFRRVEVRKPIFIVGNGRSGTTHMHRLLSGDEDRFTYFRTYEMLLPSILQKKILWWLGDIDRLLLGGAIQKRLKATEDDALGEIRSKHNWQLDGAEEDDFLWYHNFSSGSIFWPFNYPELVSLLRADHLPERTRRRQFGYYKSLIQRQLYLYGEDKVHCCKSPSFTQKVRALYETFPDARFVMMFRHPAESIPSLVDFMSWYWRGFGSPPDLVDACAAELGEANIENYRYLARMIEELPKDQQCVVDFEALVRDPKAAMEELYGRFGLEITAEFGAFLDAEREKAKRFVSGHDYDPEGQGPARARLYQELGYMYPRFGWEP